jgi:hypothetical protein
MEKGRFLWGNTFSSESGWSSDYDDEKTQTGTFDRIPAFYRTSDNPKSIPQVLINFRYSENCSALLLVFGVLTKTPKSAHYSDILSISGS